MERRTHYQQTVKVLCFSVEWKDGHVIQVFNGKMDNLQTDSESCVPER